MNSKSPEGEKSGEGIEFYPESNCLLIQNTSIRVSLKMGSGMEKEL